MSQPRHKQKRSLASHNGEVVQISRLLSSGEWIVGEAVAEMEIDHDGNVGRVMLGRINFLHACARIGAWSMFLAALDLPIKGHPDWWLISNLPVELCRYNSEVFRGPTMTRQVMDGMGFSNQ